MLAERMYINILDNYHPIVSFVEERTVGHVVNRKLIASCEEEYGLSTARRRIDQALPVGILSNTLENAAHGGSEPRLLSRAGDSLF